MQRREDPQATAERGRPRGSVRAPKRVYLSYGATSIRKARWRDNPDAMGQCEELASLCRRAEFALSQGVGQVMTEAGNFVRANHVAQLLDGLSTSLKLMAARYRDADDVEDSSHGS